MKGWPQSCSESSRRARETNWCLPAAEQRHAREVTVLAKPDALHKASLGAKTEASGSGKHAGQCSLHAAPRRPELVRPAEGAATEPGGDERGRTNTKRNLACKCGVHNSVRSAPRKADQGDRTGSAVAAGLRVPGSRSRQPAPNSRHFSLRHLQPGQEVE